MKAIRTTVRYRVIYADTDQMGVVYYGNYGKFYEIGRSEMVRDLGFAYVNLEKAGIAMPVYSVEAKYRNVLTYDELISIETTVKTMPTAKMEFFHRIFNEKGSLCHEARVVLVFQDMKTRKLVRAPNPLLEVIEANS